MFRISFFVDDKNLGEVLKRLDGLTYDTKHVYMLGSQTAVNSKPNGRGEAALNWIANALHSQHKSVILGTEIRTIVEKVGLQAPNSVCPLHPRPGG